jgi:indole-3-acetate monooxygenase
MTQNSILERAQAIGPLIRELRGSIDRDREVPSAIVEQMVSAGFYGLYVPKALSGLEVDPMTFTRVLTEIARADASPAWLLMNGGLWGCLAGRLPNAGARAIFDGGKTVCAGSLNPTGKARAVPGGFQVSGRWLIGSGIAHAQWLVVNCMVFDGDEARKTSAGAPEMRIAFVPKGECAVHDTWHVGGLRGTGSHDFTIANAFVPDDRVIEGFGAKATYPGPLYACPFPALFAAGVAAVPLGIARGAIDALIELAATKRSGGPPVLMRERANVQIAIGSAEALLRSAQAYLHEALSDVWQAMLHLQEPTMQQRTHVRLASCHAATSAVQATDLMFRNGGATSFFESCPLERAHRDVHVAAQHIGLSPEFIEVGGRVLLGLPPGTPRF